jgi:hypothetical protein
MTAKTRPEEVICTECGSVIDLRSLRILTPRSPKQHRAFFRMIDIAVQNWPESYADFRPEGVTEQDRRDHARAWLLCKAGYRRLIGQPLEAGAGDVETDRFWAAMLHASRYQIVFRVEQNGKKFGVAPRSIAVGECDPVDFRAVFEEVKFIIEEICGIKIAFTPKEVRELQRDWGFEPRKSDAKIRQGRDSEASEAGSV